MMENVGITGFDNNKPNEDVRNITVHIASCGSICEPNSKPVITCLTYRSPEVYYEKAWGRSTDIWSWGIIFAQLLLAQRDFSSPGMYDAIRTGPYDDVTQVLRERMAGDFDLFSIPFFTEGDPSYLQPLRRPKAIDRHRWIGDLQQKGIELVNVQFLVIVLKPHPEARPTANDILECEYLNLPVAL
ncbi:hypothetical protein F4678DRAFT_112029 [Xylaria arbuscula]|nr:hypothetical protein F4678DRAFT_112029 [Xylaria arbuscula]